MKELALIVLGMSVGLWIGWHAQSFHTAQIVEYERSAVYRANEELRRVLRTPPTPHECALAAERAIDADRVARIR